jgi:hypothetical protein
MAKHPLPVIDRGRSEFGFFRTVCACAGCVLNCRHLPGYLIPADLERIRREVAANEDLMDWGPEAPPGFSRRQGRARGQNLSHPHAGPGAAPRRGLHVPDRRRALRHPRGRPLRLRLLRHAHGGRRGGPAQPPWPSGNRGRMDAWGSLRTGMADSSRGGSPGTVARSVPSAAPASASPAQAAMMSLVFFSTIQTTKGEVP